MNLLIWMCLVIWPCALALYYTRKIQVFEPPTNRHLRNNSYFGYSITYDGFNKKLVISAPTENIDGEVYNCDIENQACIPIAKSVIRVSRNYTHDYWFGATVKAGPNFVMMCAPRYTAFRNNTYVTDGKCYSYYENGPLKERTTIKEIIRNGDVSKTDPIERTMDSFGWSIDVAPDDSTIVGGPGMFHGRAMIYNQHEQYPKLIMSSQVTPKFNFGYAVASGKFINNNLLYAVGSPYGTFGEGKVNFYKGVTYLKTIKGDTHSQVGSMFGAVLCAASLYGHRTDLLVGAPTYASKNTYNLGAVFVYIARKFASAPEFKRKIVGQVSGAMFGSAIVNVGDLNGDEKPEIAIGAPFEKNGHGVVYLYNGADLISELSERDLKCLQRIEPETSYSESFGMSLTPLLDYNGNGCNELAIGSPYKDTVVLLKCMAAVVVKTSAKFPVLQGRTSSNKTDFEFEVCLSVKYPRLPEKITALVSTTVEMEHYYAKLVDTDGTGHISFNTSLDDKKPVYCRNVSFILPINGKYETKISYAISSELPIDPKTLPDFNSSRVILSDRSDLTVHGTLWAAECAGNETCVPNLDITPVISFRHTDNDSYIIGSSTYETMHFIVHNYGEVAYDPCVRVHIDGANVRKTPTSCVYEDSAVGNRLKCEPLKLLHTNKTWITGEIELEMTHLTNVDKTITINMLLYNHCEDVVTQNLSIPIPMKADPGSIVAKGETDIGTIVNMTVEDIQQNGKKIQHVYTITNKGPTNWKGFQVQVTLQKQLYIDYGVNPVTLYFPTSKYYLNLPCPSVSKDETTISYLCKVKSLTKKDEFAKILIPMYMLPGTLDGMLDKDKNLTISSSIKIQFNDVDYTVESITTTLTLIDATVPIKLIIIAVIIALCIIVILVLILYKVGFLRRKKKEELEQLKSNVKRQTILKRSTMQKQPAEDQKQNLEEMAEEEQSAI